MSRRSPQYRSFKKSYGGDPDSSILRDLHRRLMKVEIAADRDRAQLKVATAEILRMDQRIQYLKQVVDLLSNPSQGVNVAPFPPLREPQRGND